MLRNLWIPCAFALLLVSGCGKLPGTNGANPGGNAAPANPAPYQAAGGGGRPATDQTYTRYVAIAGEATRHVKDVESAYVTMRQTGDYEQVRGALAA